MIIRFVQLYRGEKKRNDFFVKKSTQTGEVLVWGPFDDAENLERTIIIEHFPDEGIQTGPRRGNEVQEKKADKHEGKGNGDDRKKTLVHDLAERTVGHEHHDNYPNDVKAAANQKIQSSHEMKLEGNTGYGYSCGRFGVLSTS